MRELLAVLGDADLATVRDALAALDRAALHLAPSDRPAPRRVPTTYRKDPA
jgi:hypothetical protein